MRSVQSLAGRDRHAKMIAPLNSGATASERLRATKARRCATKGVPAGLEFAVFENYLTVSVPFIPAAAWPGTVHRYGYLPAFVNVTLRVSDLPGWSSSSSGR